MSRPTTDAPAPAPRPGRGAPTIRIDYDCCGATYRIPVRLRDDQTLLGNTALASTVLAWADAAHDAEHPACTQRRTT